MYIFTNCMRLFTVKQILRQPTVTVSCLSSHIRTYADKTKQDNKAKHIQVHGTENEERMRVRRARPADVPRVLRFVRENARAAWSEIAPPPSSSLAICDYVARALAQGHSMLAEQQESRRGWPQIRGLALCMAVSPWDATILERWAKCIRCSRSKRFLQFTAHCLRAPSLHDKYQVHNILQVIVMVPSYSSSKTSEMIQLLAKNAIQRGRELGFSVLRFDATNEDVAKVLDELNLKKECQVGYNAQEDVTKHSVEKSDSILETGKSEAETMEHHSNTDTKFITVYTALLDKNMEK